LVQKFEEKRVLREASAEDRKVLEMIILLEKKGKGKVHSRTGHDGSERE
jgi:hypothetical protein